MSYTVIDDTDFISTTAFTKNEYDDCVCCCRQVYVSNEMSKQ